METDRKRSGERTEEKTSLRSGEQRRSGERTEEKWRRETTREMNGERRDCGEINGTWSHRASSQPESPKESPKLLKEMK